MAKLQILTQFKQLFENVKLALNNYNDNLRNELFEIEPNENDEKAYQRGETIFDRCEDDLKNLTEIIQQQEEIDEFFEHCKQNKAKLLEHKNELINKLLRIKKNNVSKEEYLNIREFWNKKRDETIDQRNRRECEEMLEEIKEEKKCIDEMTKHMIQKEKELSDLIEKAKVNDIKHEHNQMKSSLKSLESTILNISNKQNEISNEFVKRNELNNFMTISHAIISQEERVQLEQWTNKRIGEMIFDSHKDDWSDNRTLNERVLNRNQLVFMIEDENNNKFGGYINEKIDKTGWSWESNISDPNAFLFSLKSNGRINGMMKFEIHHSSKTFMLSDRSNWLFCFGGGEDLEIWNQSQKASSHCYQLSYDYHGIPNALCGGRNFIPKRFVVIQMI